MNLKDHMVIILPDSSNDQELSSDEFTFMIQELKDFQEVTFLTENHLDDQPYELNLTYYRDQNESSCLKLNKVDIIITRNGKDLIFTNEDLREILSIINEILTRYHHVVLKIDQGTLKFLRDFLNNKKIDFTSYVSSQVGSCNIM